MSTRKLNPDQVRRLAAAFRRDSASSILVSFGVPASQISSIVDDIRSTVVAKISCMSYEMPDEKCDTATSGFQCVACGVIHCVRCYRPVSDPDVGVKTISWYCDKSACVGAESLESGESTDQVRSRHRSTRTVVEVCPSL